MTSSSAAAPPISGTGRAAAILKAAFKHDARPKRLIDLSRLTGLSPATVSRITKELVDTRLLTRNKDKSFAPGPDLIEIANAVLADPVTAAN